MAHDYTYQHLDEDDKAAIEAETAAHDQPAEPVVDDALRAAWEADHYAHSVLLTTCEDDECRTQHETAMATIEAALTEHSG